MRVRTDLPTVYVRISQYSRKTKKHKHVDQVTVYDSDAKKVTEVIRKALEQTANGK